MRRARSIRWGSFKVRMNLRAYFLRKRESEDESNSYRKIILEKEQNFLKLAFLLYSFVGEIFF